MQLQRSNTACLYYHGRPYLSLFLNPHIQYDRLFLFYRMPWPQLWLYEGEELQKWLWKSLPLNNYFYHFVYYNYIFNSFVSCWVNIQIKPFTISIFRIHFFSLREISCSINSIEWNTLNFLFLFIQFRYFGIIKEIILIWQDRFILYNYQWLICFLSIVSSISYSCINRPSS